MFELNVEFYFCTQIRPTINTYISRQQQISNIILHLLFKSGLNIIIRHHAVEQRGCLSELNPSPTWRNNTMSNSGMLKSKLDTSKANITIKFAISPA